MKSAAEIWSISISKLPKNIYNFSIRYVDNFLVDASRIYKWGKTACFFMLCLHCNEKLTLGYGVAACETSLREKHYHHRH